MATNNTIKLADTLISYIKTQLCGELTADNCRLVVGKSYLFQGDPELGDFQCSPRGVKLIPKGEDFMDLTWSKFIKFCRENGLMEEATTPCNPKPARNAAAAVTAAAPAATPTAETSTILESAEDAEASTLKPSSPDVQTPLSAPASPADAGVATQSLSAAAPASSAVQPSASSAFDYAGLDLPTVDILHLAERMISDARRDYVTKLAQAVYIAHDALCGGVVHNVDNSKHGNRGDETFRLWCESVGMGKTTAYKLLQVAGLLNGATPEEQAVLEAASPSLLYAAAKPSAPAQLVQGVKDGDITTHKQYQELLAQLKAKEEELAAEKAAHKAESDAFGEALADEQRLRQASDAARIEAESAVRGLQEICSGASKSENAAIQRAQEAEQQLAAAQDQLRTKTARVKELEARPIEVKGADPDDIARWRAEGAKQAQAQLDKAQAEAAALRERLAELEAGPSGGDAVALARQAAAGVETILQGQFALLDALPYDTYEAAAAPYEALRNRLTAALELGRWPEQ